MRSFKGWANSDVAIWDVLSVVVVIVFIVGVSIGGFFW